jgi:hypothetical protein
MRFARKLLRILLATVDRHTRKLASLRREKVAGTVWTSPTRLWDTFVICSRRLRGIFSRWCLTLALDAAGCLFLLRSWPTFYFALTHRVSRKPVRHHGVPDLAHRDGGNRTNHRTLTAKYTVSNEDAHTFLRGTCPQCDGSGRAHFPAASTQDAFFGVNNRRPTVGCRDLNL